MEYQLDHLVMLMMVGRRESEIRRWRSFMEECYRRQFEDFHRVDIVSEENILLTNRLLPIGKGQQQKYAQERCRQSH